MSALLFNPLDHVPLSAFAEVSELDARPAELRVHPSIVQYVAGNGGRLAIARYADGEIRLEEPLAFDPDRSCLLAKPGKPGTIVAVSGLLINDFPISTGWSADTRGGRGGPCAGASDGIGVLSYDESTGTIEAKLEWPDDPEGGKAPRSIGYNRYIGDSYSLFAVEPDAALKLSCDTLAATGYPVLFRNARTNGTDAAAGMSARKESGVDSGLPVFQAWLNEAIKGEEGAASLASFLLPPGWLAAGNVHPDAGEGGYASLFVGYYDQNESVFRHCGLDMLKTIGGVLERTGRGTVGIMWNGGGSIGTRTQQPAAFAMLNRLFRVARERFGIDPNGIVAAGGSRGGLTALLAACNPVADGYAIRYAVCYGVPFSLYGEAKTLLNPTNAALWEAVCSDTGHKDAWKAGWTDEQGNGVVERYRLNTFGTAEEARIARELYPGSRLMLEALKRSGTRIWLNASTNDPFTPFSAALDWLKAAGEAGIPVRCEIGYRHGHNNCTDPYASAAACVEAVMGGEDPVERLKEQIEHYRRSGEADDEWKRTERWSPERAPVLFEGPKVAVAGKGAMLSVYGPPGTRCRLSIHLSGAGETEHTECSDPLVLIDEILPELGALPIAYIRQWWIPPDVAAGKEYEYELTYRLAGEAEWERIEAQHVPHPGSGVDRRPTLAVLREEPDYTGEQWRESTMKHFIGWGLCEA